MVVEHVDVAVLASVFVSCFRILRDSHAGSLAKGFSKWVHFLLFFALDDWLDVPARDGLLDVPDGWLDVPDDLLDSPPTGNVTLSRFHLARRE